MIEVEGLQKKYGDLLAVDGVSFIAEPGKIFGLLGPNGAGKTTTIGCISGLLQPTAGRIRVLGHDVAIDGRAAKQQLGVVPRSWPSTKTSPPPRTSASGAGPTDCTGPGSPSGSTSARGHRIARPRQGAGQAFQRRHEAAFESRLRHRPSPQGPALGRADRGRGPPVPGPAVGPGARGGWPGATVLYTTHYMEEAEDLCDRLAIIDHGRIIAQGTLAELRAMVAERDVLVLSGKFDPTKSREALTKIDGVEVALADEGSLRLTIQGATCASRVLRRPRSSGRRGPRDHAHPAKPRKPLYQAHREATAGVSYG